MRYTKDNIDGLKFKCRLSKTIYTIDLKDKCNIKWNEGPVFYEISVIVDYLNSGTWIVENSEIFYEIY